MTGRTYIFALPRIHGLGSQLLRFNGKECQSKTAKDTPSALASFRAVSNDGQRSPRSRREINPPSTPTRRANSLQDSPADSRSLRNRRGKSVSSCIVPSILRWRMLAPFPPILFLLQVFPSVGRAALASGRGLLQFRHHPCLRSSSQTPD